MHRSQGFPSSLQKRRRDECEGTLRTGNVEVSLCIDVCTQANLKKEKEENWREQRVQLDSI